PEGVSLETGGAGKNQRSGCGGNGNLLVRGRRVMTEERLAYLALTQVPGMGPARLAALLPAYPSPLGAHSAPFELLCTVPGFSRAMATALKETPLATGQKTLEAAELMGVSVLLPADGGYPA